jgi:hypothetical protein
MRGTNCYLKKIRLFIATGFVFILSSGQVSSQDLKLEGRVYNKLTGEAITDVSVQDVSSLNGALTDRTGIFKLKLKRGFHKLVFSHIGYLPLDTVLNLSGNLFISVKITQSDLSPGEVKITAENTASMVSSSRMGSVGITGKEITKLPALLGESDPLGILRLTPGIQAGAEGSTGFFVRGGSTDQNLILYNNTLVYNPGHLLGFFSVFNPEMIREVNIIKSGIPARYGGKLSSVIIINSSQGNSDSLEMNGSVGIVSSRFTLSGPLLKNKKLTFIAGARRTYLGLIVEPVIRNLVDDNSFFKKGNLYSFYDLNAGISLVTPKDRLSLSAYTGRDIYKMAEHNNNRNNKLDWGNTISSVMWNHDFSSNARLSTDISYTGYSFGMYGSQKDYSLRMFSSAKDLSLKSEMAVSSGRHTISTGIELTEHNFIPDRINASAGNFVLNFGQLGRMKALEGGIFFDEDFSVSERLSISAGLRYSFFTHHGPFTEIARNSSGETTDTVYYPRYKNVAFYSGAEPRFVAKFSIDEASSLKASYMRIFQYIHQATSAAISLPTDVWMPSTSGIKPMRGDQVSIGWYRNFDQNRYEFSSEIYYKEMHNKLEFLRGIVYNSIFGSIQDNLASGFARSYGVEFYLRKKRGNLTGWISYTLARTEQRFGEINEGKFYPAKHDRRHDVGITLIRQLNEKWSASCVFVFATGNAYTLPVGRYVIQGNIMNQYGDVNTFRMPPYHRLDISLTRKMIIAGRITSELNFSVFNVYNRSNPYFIYFEAEGNLEDYSLQVNAVTEDLFPIIPSVSWSFNF